MHKTLNFYGVCAYAAKPAEFPMREETTSNDFTFARSAADNGLGDRIEPDVGKNDRSRGGRFSGLNRVMTSLIRTANYT